MQKKKLLMLGLSALLINGAWSQIPRNGSEQKQKAQEEQNRPKIVQPSLPTIQEEKHPSEEKHDSSSQSRNYPWRESLAHFTGISKTPQRIEIPRIIRPNSHDIPFSTTVYSSFGKAASFDEISTVLNRYKPRKRMEGSTISPATGLRTSPIPKIMNNFALFCRVRIEYSAAQKTWIKEVRAKLWVFADHDTTPEYGRWEYYDEKEQCDEGCSG
jgi:hypothetical protein